jgi:transposase-like protein
VGAALAERVSGSAVAQERLKVLLETITGGKSMDQACQALGIRKSQLFKLRQRALQAAAAALEPQPLGRPSQPAGPEAERIAELEQRRDELEVELQAARVRVELAQVMSARPGEAPVTLKKTTRPGRPRRQR